MDNDIVARRTDTQTGSWVEIVRDFECSENPIQDWDWSGVTTMTPRYSEFGNDKKHHPYDVKFQKYLRGVRAEGGVVIPIYCLDHSSSCISFNSGSFHDPWDSRIAGFAWMSPESVSEKYKGDKQAAIKHLERMVRVMNAVAQDECYGYRAYGPNGHERGSCYGFWNTYQTWQEFMNMLAEEVPGDFSDMVRDCNYGELDPIATAPSLPMCSRVRPGD